MSTDPLSCYLAFDFIKITPMIIVLLVLLMLSAFCSATETAYMSLNLIRIKQLSHGYKKKNKKAKKVYKLCKRPVYILNTILILNNIVNLGISSLVTYIFVDNLGLEGTGVLLSTAISSVAVIIMGEIIPKNLAKLYPERFAMFIYYPLTIMIFILKPLTYWFTKLNDKLEERAEESEEKVTATEEELVELVETIEREGVLEHNEAELITNSIKFDETTVRKVMVDAKNVVTVKENATLEEVTRLFLQQLYARMPVMNAKGEIIGVINQVDVFAATQKVKSTGTKVEIKDLMRKPFFISHRRMLPDALEKAQRYATHMLIVVDNMKEKNYLGIITMEDMLEEIVGEIYDEHDDIPEDIVEIGNHIFIVSGSYDLSDLFDDYLEDSDMPKTNFKTVGGWIRSLCPKRLSKEHIITFDNLVIKILEHKDNVIKLVEITEETKLEEDDE